MAWTTPKTWVANQTLTASELNTHVRDNLNALHTWTSYTPTWAGTGGTPSVGNGSLGGYYLEYGGVVHVAVILLWGSTTTADTATAWTFTLPSGLPIVGTAAHWVMPCQLFDSGTGVYPAIARPASSTTMEVRVAAGTAVGATTPFTWAVNDYVAFNGVYRAA